MVEVLNSANKGKPDSIAKTYQKCVNQILSGTKLEKWFAQSNRAQSTTPFVTANACAAEIKETHPIRLYRIKAGNYHIGQ